MTDYTYKVINGVLQYVWTPYHGEDGSINTWSLSASRTMNKWMFGLIGNQNNSFLDYLAAVPMAAIGLGKRVIADLTQDGDFQILEGDAEVKELEDGQEFTIATWNMLCFPEEMTRFTGGLPKWKERLDGIIGKIKEADADILVLQENMDPEAGYTIFNHPDIKKEFARCLLESGMGIIKMPSGLMVLSKLELHDVQAELLRTKIGGDHFVNKMIVHFKIKDVSGRVAHIAFSHFQSGSPEKKGKTRLNPLVHSEEMSIQQVRNDNAKQILETGADIICGDLNSDRLRTEVENFPLNPAVNDRVLDSITDEETCTTYFEHSNGIREKHRDDWSDDQIHEAAQHVLEMRKRVFDENETDLEAILAADGEYQTAAADYIRSEIKGKENPVQAIKDLLVNMSESLDRNVLVLREGETAENSKLIVGKTTIIDTYDTSKPNTPEFQISDHKIVKRVYRFRTGT